MKPIFYTLPDVSYSYFLVNRKNYRVLFKRSFEHAIIDSGVMDFVSANVTDYPVEFLQSWIWKAKQLNEAFKGKTWFVIPDYPDDYNPGQFGDNVAKTLTNIKWFMEEAPELSWLPVIQSRYQDKFSFLESTSQLHNMIGDYPRVAIGTICKCRNLDFILYCSKVARKWFPKSWIHAFGLTLTALPKTVPYLDSFDSMAWTFPRGRGGHSCRNQKERNQYFYTYLNSIEKLLEVHP